MNRHRFRIGIAFGKNLFWAAVSGRNRKDTAFLEWSIMDRTLEYLITEPDHHTKISTFLQKQGYSAKILTSLRRTSFSFELVPGEQHERKALQELLPGDASEKQRTGNDLKKIYPGEVLQDVHMNEYVYAGDRLKVLIRETEQSEKILPVELPFPVVYEDEDLVVVNKPPGMPIHPSIRHYDNTLGNAAAWYFKDRDDRFVYRCINRLDKDTTGLTIIAKNPLAGHLLQEQMRQDRITRIYTAIVEGVPEPLEGIIDLPIARKDASIIERQVDQERGEPAVTHFKVLENLGDCALVQLRLETGRTHQIRVHMKAVGHPLLGDYMYNPAYKDREDTRQALHAGELIFFQPVSGEKIHLRAELPGDMQEIIEGYAGACKGL